MKKIAVAMGIATLTGAAFAQGIVVERVQGAATVASGSQAMSVSTNMALTENATVTTTQGSSVTIKFPSGCTAVVAGGVSFVVSEANCQDLLAKAGGGTVGNAGANNTALMIAGGLVGGLVIHEATKGDSGTPSVQTPPPGGPTAPTPSSPAPQAPAKPKPRPTPISPS